ncbi:MAG: peptide chain release factor N(5)-glutamine methyltransferase [Mailhella sp.]|nr:peptide chain release factor N(5)-glutamine methyltransferase [Mailhella sp.]
MTRKEWKIQATRRLAHTDAPALTAQLLLCHVLGIDRVALIAHSEEAVPPEAVQHLEALLERRESGEPLAYILGSREFYGRDFAVTRHTLIPRPETEHLIESALDFFDKLGAAEKPLRFLDLGTGSGCIAVTLAAERPTWQGTALDISTGALETARRNAEAHGGNLSFLLADFTQPLPFESGSFDLVVSNPPYISEEEYAGLDAGVRDFEPRSALVPGPEGMEHPRAVEEAARRLLRPGGLFLMEHGWLQGEACRALCCEEFWNDIHTGRDLAGKERFLFAVRTSKI